MKIDRIHFYTKNAAKIKDWFVRNIGFNAIARESDEHTQREIIALNSACLVFASPLTNSSPVAQYLDSHPSGVFDVSFRVKDVERIVNRANKLGLKIFQSPQFVSSSLGKVKQAKIQGWNSLRHTLVEDKFDSDLGIPLNTKKKFERPINNFDPNITNIDHIVLNVAAGKLNAAVELYQTLFGFKIQQSFDIQTKTSGLYSKALIDDTGKVQFNINEPSSNNSQIQEFINFNNGSGIQHLALRSHNLIADIKQMRQKNVAFLNIPQTYYSQIKPSINLSSKEWQAISHEQILVDCDRTNSQSLLMQIFTQPIFEKPTFFLEFIERRKQAKGFGQGNFKALFEAVEREQIKSNF